MTSGNWARRRALAPVAGLCAALFPSMGSAADGMQPGGWGTLGIALVVGAALGGVLVRSFGGGSAKTVQPGIDRPPQAAPPEPPPPTPSASDAPPPPAPDRWIEAILDGLNDGVAVWDGEDRLVVCNARFRSFLEPVAADLVPGAVAAAVFDHAVTIGVFGAESAESVRADLSRMRQSAEDAVERHLADGRWVTFIERRIDQGWLTLVIDISARKDRERETLEWWQLLENQTRELDALTHDLSVAKQAAEEANRSKTAFLAGMSHELRTPLNAVLGFAEIIRDQVFGRQDIDRYSAYAADVHSSGIHLLSLINDILDLSKIEAGRTELREEDVESGALINAALALVRETAERRGIALRLLPSAAVTLKVDPTKLKQCLLNILSNGIKFTAPGGSVSVWAWADSRSFTISIQDTGIGISPKDLPRVFEPFGQVDGAISRPEKGTGLGMPLTKALMELHGGTVAIDSEPGRGTTVHLRLPLARLANAATA